MLDIEPPEVPTDLLAVTVEKPKPARESFFKRLFSRKKQDATIIPEMPPVTESTLPELPPLEVPQLDDWKEKFADTNNAMELPKKVIGKGRGKKAKGKQADIARLDITKNFTWTEPINNQDNFIKDSNRNNEDVNKLIEASEQHVIDTQNNMQTVPEIASEEMTHTDVKSVSVPEDINNVLPKAEQESDNVMLNIETPMVHPEEQKVFNELDRQHNNLRKKLEKTIRSKGFSANKKEFMQLLKNYDERIEHKIERKQLELSKKHNKIEDLGKQLQAKGRDLSKLHVHLKRFEKELSEKSARLDKIISNAVLKQVASRTAKDRKILNNGLKDTLKLNNQLRRKLDVLENDRIRFDKKKERLIAVEHKKITEAHIMYENKLMELTAERNSLMQERTDFEAKRTNALEMLRRAGEVAAELKEIQHLQEIVQNDKRAIDKELIQDKELKYAIQNAEARLNNDKKNLDNMIFSKYIDWKLNSAPNSLLSPSVFKDEIDNIDKNTKLYPMITECRDLIAQKKIFDAKVLYNKIKQGFESSDMDKNERNMIYNSLRALYNEIKLAELTYVAD